LKLIDEHNKHKKKMEKTYFDETSMKDILCKCNVLKCKCEHKCNWAPQTQTQMCKGYKNSECECKKLLQSCKKSKSLKKKCKDEELLQNANSKCKKKQTLSIRNINTKNYYKIQTQSAKIVTLSRGK
jgi:hypothetical protein